jgi:ribulose-5-phosphate 4-epimerase/fuculose-1-phosphate aldolase
MKSLPEKLTPSELIAYAAKYFFDKELTDAAGGNISIKVGDDIFMTPTLAGTEYHWQIGAEDVVLGSFHDMGSLKNHPRFSREGFSHLSIYQAFPYIGAVVHAHPKYVNAFVAQSRPIPALMRASEKLGELEYHEDAEPYSQDQADKIVKVLKKNEEAMKAKAGVVLMPRHGIIIASKDLMTALDILERVNNNAMVILAQKLFD